MTDDRTVAMRAGDGLPLIDLAVVVLAGQASLLAYAALHKSLTEQILWQTVSPLIWVAAAIAPFLLYERSFAALAGARDYSLLARRFASRLLLFVGVIASIAFAGRWFDKAPGGWLALWLGGAVVLAVASRAALAVHLRRGCSTERASEQPTRHVGDSVAVALLADRPIRRWNGVLKSIEDGVLGTLMLITLLPVLAMIAAAIKLDSRGPILFKQRRHGLHNREFNIYKFRTMQCTTGESSLLQQTTRGDARITRVGHFLRRFSLDELPQVFNVLQGDMSLVGPRPHAVNMRTEDLLGPEVIDVYPHRHRVKPGISGWSQINGSRGATQTVGQLRRRVELDLHYVENWSLLLDLRILILTFREVVRATNAY